MRIIARSSCIVVEGYNLGDSLELERNFQVWDPITHSYKVIGYYYDEENHNLYLPRGLDIWKIKQYLKQTTVSYENYDPYKPTKNILMKYKPRDEQQSEALRFMIGVNEYAGNVSEPQLSVNLNTGKGKTYCSIATISVIQIKSIIITGSNTLLSQWRDNIVEYTNLTTTDVFWLDGSNTMNMVLANRSQKANNASIYLCTHSTIKSFGDTYGWDNVRKVFMNLGIGMIFFDEAHTHFENMLMVGFFTNVYKTYYVTATPARSDFRENRIYQLSIKNVPGVDLFDAENDPHTEYVAIKWNSRPTAQQISACKNQYGLDRNKYISYLIRNNNFYLMMRIVMDLVIKCEGRALIYIGTNEGILAVYKWIGENYPEFLGDIGIYTSLVDKSNKILEKDKKLMLSTTKSAGLGEHIEGLKLTIVLAEPFKSHVIARQTLGRTRDRNTMYVELVDMGFIQLRNYYWFKLPVFEKYACGVSDTTIDQYELERRASIIDNSRKHPAWIQCPIKLHDERFFEYKEEERKKVICPIRFADEE